jgi:hypothetical protein
MSDGLVLLTWSNYPGRSSKLAVLTAIAEGCNSQGHCHPHIAELAGISRLSRSTVFIAIKALRKDRWIFTDRVTGQGGFLIFQINVPKLRRSTRFDLCSGSLAVRPVRSRLPSSVSTEREHPRKPRQDTPAAAPVMAFDEHLVVRADA